MFVIIRSYNSDNNNSNNYTVVNKKIDRFALEVRDRINYRNTNLYITLLTAIYLAIECIEFTLERIEMCHK